MTVFFFNLAQSAARRNAFSNLPSGRITTPRRTSQCAWRNRGIFKSPTLLVEWEVDKFEPNWGGERGYWRRVTWWERGRPQDFSVIEGRPGV